MVEDNTQFIQLYFESPKGVSAIGNLYDSDEISGIKVHPSRNIQEVIDDLATSNTAYRINVEDMDLDYTFFQAILNEIRDISLKTVSKKIDRIRNCLSFPLTLNLGDAINYRKVIELGNIVQDNEKTTLEISRNIGFYDAIKYLHQSNNSRIEIAGDHINPREFRKFVSELDAIRQMN